MLESFSHIFTTSFLLEQRFHFYLKWTLFGIYMTKEAIIISQFSKKKKDKRKRVISINTGSESCLFQLFLLLSRFNVPLPPFVLNDLFVLNAFGAFQS